MAPNTEKFRKRPRRRRNQAQEETLLSRMILPGLFIAALIGVAISFKFTGPAVKESSASPLANAEITSVYDGDTFRIGSERIRILGMDAPELGKRAKCQEEERAALQARSYLRDKLYLGVIKIARSGKDIYGRTLATVFVDGRNIANEMIKKGLAIPYSPSTHGEWCNLMSN